MIYPFYFLLHVKIYLLLNFTMVHLNFKIIISGEVITSYSYDLELQYNLKRMF